MSPKHSGLLSTDAGTLFMSVGNIWRSQMAKSEGHIGASSDAILYSAVLFNLLNNSMMTKSHKEELLGELRRLETALGISPQKYNSSKFGDTYSG